MLLAFFIALFNSFQEKRKNDQQKHDLSVVRGRGP